MKKTRIIVAIIMTLTLCLSLAPIALAAPDENSVTSAAITKLLMVPEGTTYPNIKYEFTVSPYAYNYNVGSTSKLPILGTQIGETSDGLFEIDFASGVTLRETTEEGITTYYKQSGNLFTTTFPNAGVYAYTIEETGTNPIFANTIHQKLYMSQAKYLMTVMVRESNGATEIYNIAVQRLVEDDGNVLEEEEVEKVNPTPDTGDEDFPYSGMTFTNKYIKTKGAPDPFDPENKNPDPRDPRDPTDGDDNEDKKNPDLDKPNYIDPRHTTMNVIKRVKGELGSLTEPFKFSLMITVPDLVEGYNPDFYNAFIIGPTGFVTPTNVVGGTVVPQANNKPYIAVKPGVAVSFELKHNEALFFTNTPVGTRYTVTETAEDGYTTSIRVHTDGAKGARLVRLISGEQKAGEGFNAATYYNDFGDPTAGGLNVNDLPFYGLILLAIGGLILFVVIKARNRDKD